MAELGLRLCSASLKQSTGIWKAAKAGISVEALGLDTVKTLLAQDKKAALLELVAQDAALAEEAGNIDMVDKVVLLKFGKTASLILFMLSGKLKIF